MFRKVLIANRGEIACRISRTLRKMGVRVVAIYSEPDRHAPHVLEADEAYSLEGSTVSESYLRTDRILEICQQSGAEAVHPGYGLLSENAAFAEQCQTRGIQFIGPRSEHLRDFGLKHAARRIARDAGIPLLPGTDLLDSLGQALEEVERIGYPVMLKSSAGGGGIGIRRCNSREELIQGFESVTKLAESNFGGGGVFIERFISRARHIEVQIFGDGSGRVVTLGERDCSVQRRNQKVIEETPAPNLSLKLRKEMWDSARKLGESVSYASAGTVEFVYDQDRDEYYFLEVNTRLQVEHGITEMVTGIDLVEWMVQLAASHVPDFSKVPAKPDGHAIEVRIYSEDPVKNHAPSSGLITEMQLPDTGRVDHWISPGTEVTPYYDPLLAKIMIQGRDRKDAIAQTSEALRNTSIHGIETNLDYLRQILQTPEFQAGKATTRYLDQLPCVPRTIEVLEGGMLSTVQDFPGRLGFWDVGVPPSGPMDALSFRIGNALLGNPDSVAGIEYTMTGPVLRFLADIEICITGAATIPTLDGVPIPTHEVIKAEKGSTLTVGNIEEAGQRGYILVAGGLDIPLYMGSRSTFQLGQFGGHSGRALRTGDMLRLFPDRPKAASNRLISKLRPKITHKWTLRVTMGPHAAPDFFTPKDIDTFFEATWKVHFNSARTGIRLIGPKPEWARSDGGEAGLHPSNIHDNAYAVGTVDFTGDMPVILGPDGPSLGGFVCPATVIKADLWKLGQVKAGDTVSFELVPSLYAEDEERLQNSFIESIRDGLSEMAPTVPWTPSNEDRSPILDQIDASENSPRVVYRRAGEDNVLIEYGDPTLDLRLRARVHALWSHLQEHRLPGIIDLTPGIRSLQIHFDNQSISSPSLLKELRQIEEILPSIEDMRFPSRIVHLPLSWDDDATRLAIERYMRAVRADAPWCPSNIEFIRRINGLDTIDEVKDILYSANYLVLGLGDVYLGAPVATPVDPRHRLVTTKYNPARTWTPENAVGIGGAYLCVYGMEGPGGYQFVGRTIQMWNRYRSTADFQPGKPWLLRFFDQIRFYEVSPEELLRMRDGLPYGKYKLEIEQTEFDLGEFNRFLQTHQSEIDQFKSRQQSAFNAERERWKSLGIAEPTVPSEPENASDQASFDPRFKHACASLPGSVWKILVQPGDVVKPEQPLLIIESMKMEIPVKSTVEGTVASILTKEGSPVSAGEKLISILP